VRWWIRPLVRLLAAIGLPLAVPALITAALWLLPGDPAEIVCPPGLCDATQALAERWELHRGPVHFYTRWLQGAVVGEFGRSWRVAQGIPVAELLWESLPNTSVLVGLAVLPMLIGGLLAAFDVLPRRLDVVWQGFGLVPAVILALVCAAFVQIRYGALSYDGWPGTLRLLLGALVLGIADGALAGAIVGTRSVFSAERRQRYLQFAVLRGESALANALPNVLPALLGQLRARVLHVLSGAVVVEVVLGIPGLGELLWDGTLLQDFGVVLPAAWAFSLLAGALLFVQGVGEIVVAWQVRRVPAGVVEGGA